MSHEPNTIRITVKGGVIQAIENIPPSVRVVVRDYDVDGTERAVLGEDESGSRFIESEWT